MEQQKNERDFSHFRKSIKTARAATARDSYKKYGFKDVDAVRLYADLDEIRKIICNGDPKQLRLLSKYFFRTNGIYRNAILMLANLPLYDTVVSPVFDIAKPNLKQRVMRAYNKACQFIDDINVPTNFARISLQALKGGIYYGIMRESAQGVTIQDLPTEYCRTRFKDYNSLDIVEFNLHFFDTISDDNLRLEAIMAYPEQVQKAYKKYKNGAILMEWVQIPPSEGGLCFTYGDRTPLFVSSIPQIYQMEEAADREAKRDENELYKLLIQKMPINSKGELVFSLDEVAEMHEDAAEMLKNDDTIEIFTTFGDTTMQSVQDTTAASQSADRIEKYQKNTYDNLGISSLYFNPDTASSMSYATAKDQAFMGYMTNQYAHWLEYQINRRYGKHDVYFNITILPTTRFNKKEIQSQFFQGAQYGYSKIYAGVALGIKQIDILPLITFENDFLSLAEHMMPLQSSYTSNSSNIVDNKKMQNSVENGAANHIQGEDNSGRPENPIQQKSDKTLQNEDNA